MMLLMKLLFDIFPVFLFFIFYKIYGIYIATSVAMVASVVQVLWYRIKHQRFEWMHCVSLVLIVGLGSATLIFHNPNFIKMKPTGIYWLSALIFLGSSFIGKKPIIQKVMDNALHLPLRVWYRLNSAWVVFFTLMGALNWYVAYTFATTTWVNFKLFGCTGMTLLFILLQALYIARHTKETELMQEGM